MATRSTRHNSNNSNADSVTEQGRALFVSIPTLGERLIRTHKHRDPLRYYDVVKVLGDGSMGSVSKVHKRTFGGSARQSFVQEQQQQQQRSKKGASSLFALLPCLDFCFPGKRPERNYTERNVLVVEVQKDHEKVQGQYNSTGTTVSGLTQDEDEDSHDQTLLPQQVLATKTARREQYHKKSSSLISFGTQVSVDFALKSIILNQCRNADYRTELLHEIQILRGLDHPNIVRAIETYDYRNQLYLVLELCSGGDLYTRDPYSERQAASITYSLLDAVAYLHSKNITHRDLKYENIMFAHPNSDTVKIIDFGLAKKYGKTQDAGMNETVGTIYTMSPEVLKGNYYDQKCDVWSMGVIAYMLLSSAMPFYGETVVQVAKKIQQGQWKFVGRKWKANSRECKAFIKRLLVQEPKDRPTATLAMEDLWFEKEKDFKEEEDELSFSTAVMDRVQATMQMFAGYSRLKKLALLVIAHQSIDEEIGFLRRVFLHRFDTEKANANVSFPEFKEALRVYDYSDEECVNMFNAIDIDGAGRVSFTEFLAATIEAHGTIEEERIAEAFDRLDCDDSGYITANNLKDMLGHEVDESFIHKMIEEVKQKDDHRHITYNEFLGLWNSDDDEQFQRTLLEVEQRRARRE